MDLCEPIQPAPIVVAVDLNSTPEQACQVFFYGDYHYCGDAGGGYVQCCPGGSQ
ncbi:MAG TPA: hypothetical protein VGJ09_13410 [Bryobacteraceae bacterium]|jgi:hypothetical protein